MELRRVFEKAIDVFDTRMTRGSTPDEAADFTVDWTKAEIQRVQEERELAERERRLSPRVRRAAEAAQKRAQLERELEIQLELERPQQPPPRYEEVARALLPGRIRALRGFQGCGRQQDVSPPILFHII
jgi:ATP-dependent Clp protease ATP-binding subunit ClpA